MMNRELIVEKTKAPGAVKARYHQAGGKGRVRIGRMKPIHDLVVLGRLLLQREAVEALPLAVDPGLLLKMDACVDQAKHPVRSRLLALVIQAKGRAKRAAAKAHI